MEIENDMGPLPATGVTRNGGTSLLELDHIFRTMTSPSSTPASGGDTTVDVLDIDAVVVPGTDLAAETVWKC